MEKLTIREAKENDLKDIVLLYTELDEQNFDFEKAKIKFNKLKNNPDHKIYVAELDFKIIGTFAVVIINSFAHKGRPSAVIEDVAVRKDFQGKGIGKRMMHFALEKCSELGCYKMALSSMFKREAAHKFYESLGFEKMGYSFAISIPVKV